MIAYIIIYRDVIEHIIAKLIVKCFTRLKVMVGQRVLQCSHAGSCKKERTV